MAEQISRPPSNDYGIQLLSDSNTYEDPPISYGIILFYTKNQTRFYQCAQRRDSISYVTFMRDKMPKDKYQYYFGLITNDERERLKKYSFDDLWDDLMINHSGKIYKSEYQHAKDHFDEIKNSGKLDEYLNTTESKHVETEWEFPKGRKKFIREEPLHCALREFFEETKIPIQSIEIIDCEPFVFTYTGTDGKKYTTVYFLAECSDIIPVTYRNIQNGIRKHTVSEEVSDIIWRTIEESKIKLTPDKFDLLLSIEEWLDTNDQYHYRKKPFIRFSKPKYGSNSGSKIRSTTNSSKKSKKSNA